MLLSPLVWKSKRAPIVVILLHAGKEKLKPCTATPGLWIKPEEACTSRSRVALHQGQHGRKRAPTTPSPHLPPSPRHRLSGRRPSRMAARIAVAVTARSTPLWPDLPEGGRLVAGMATTTVEAWLGRRRQGCKRRAGSGPPEADLATRRSDWASSQRGQRSSQRWVGDNGRALSRSAHRGRSMAA